MKIKTNLRGLCTLFLSSSLLLAISCDGDRPTEPTITTEELPPLEQQETRLAVAPPITGLDVPFVDYTVQVSEGAKLTTTTGSTIEIPANAFVDQRGNPIEGEVTIKFREFHNATDIVASGIPMHNPADGSYMETAGMFEIKGEQAGKEIFVKGTENINVNLASFNEGDQFNFYELSPKDCSWEDKGTAKATPNTAKENQLKLVKQTIEKAKGRKPRCSKDVENYVFELEVNYGRFAELKAYKNVLWEYAAIGPNPEKEAWIFETNWDDIAIEQRADGLYDLKLTTIDNDKSFTTTVRPILGDKDYQKALAKFNATKGKEVAEIIKKQEARRAQLEQVSNINRAFQINGFGIYNWDIWHRSNRIRCQPEIMVSKDAGNMYVDGLSYFLVASKGRSVVRYDNGTMSKFSFNPDEKNSLLAIAPDGAVAVFTAEDFSKLDLAAMKNNGEMKVPFNLTLIPTQVNNMADLDEIIQTAMAS